MRELRLGLAEDFVSYGVLNLADVQCRRLVMALVAASFSVEFKLVEKSKRIYVSSSLAASALLQPGG